MKLTQAFKAGQYQKQKQVQKLKMTQQLQQSIQMLAYSNDELQQFISTKALENPFLELNWEEHKFETTSYKNIDGDQVQKYIEQLPSNYESLYSYLEEQIYINYRKTKIRDLVLELLKYIDTNGYLNIDLNSLVTSELPEMMWLDALTLLQQLEPAGVGARNLQECLLLQIERDNTAPNLAYIIVEDDLEDFINHKWDKIAKKYQIELIDVQEISDYLLTLTPHPGNNFSNEENQSIIPELTLRRENNELYLTLNKYGQPQVTFETNYYNDIVDSGDADAIDFAKDKRNEVVWIQNSLRQRQETIFEVGNAIVNYQKEFFLNDKHPLKPLTLADLAKKLKVHESTISRAINGKYIETWFGIFELKSLFAKKAANSEDTSVKEIKDEIRKIINDENKAKPYSDQKLVDILKEKGHKISRRTVAKYRDELDIPASSKRKRII